MFEGRREGLHILHGSPTQGKENMRDVRGLDDHGLIPRRTLFDKTHTVSYFHSDVGHHKLLYEHVEDLRKKFGDCLNIGDVSHSPVWTGYSIGIDVEMLKQRELVSLTLLSGLPPCLGLVGAMDRNNPE